MTVKIPMNDHLKGYKYYQAVYLGDPLERFDAVVEGDFLVFETTHLSQYAILGSNTPFSTSTVQDEEQPTQAPVTQAPTTVAPVTQAPTTVAPVTQAPTTVKKATVKKPYKVKGVKLKAGKKRVTVTFKKAKNAKKYIVKYSTKKNMKKAKTVTTKKLKVTIKKLQSKKRIYVQVQAVNGSVKGKISSRVSVKVK